MDIAEAFPSLVVQDCEGHKYSGFIEVLDQHFHLSFVTPHGCDDLTDFEMECDSQMANMLNTKLNLVEQRVKKSSTLLEFIMELTVLLEASLQPEISSHASSFTVFHSELMDQLNSVGWDKVVHISESLLEVHLKKVDQMDREHILKIYMTEQFPDIAPVCKTLLPEEFSLDRTKAVTLKSIFDQFVQQIDKFQEYWTVMDEVDKGTWVLEPENPTREDTRRRISVAPSASILVTIDPKQPLIMPEFKFLGPDRIIGPLKEKLMRADVEVWDSTKSLLFNIKTVFGIDLPNPCDTVEEEYKVECGVCYTHILDGAVPDAGCDYTNCGQLYHQVCLYEWLRALPNSRQNFNIIFGDCPYCSKPINSKVPTNAL